MLESVHALFNHAGLRNFLVRLRVPIFVALAIAAIAWMQPRLMPSGFAISLLGELIQLWCFATLDKNQRLCSRGPYAVVRNPMYLGRFLIILGPLVAFGIGWLLAVYAIVYYLYMVNRVKREEALLGAVLGEDYRAYLTEVNRFVPGRRFRSEPVWVWDWELFRRNHGPKNFAALLLFWATAFAWHGLR
jgi:protein-S-isoprenylcysteine O-methyltransferase Ste14